MPIPADFVLRAGHYVNDATGERIYACNCPGSKLTLKRLATERDKWTPVQLLSKAQGANNAGKAV